MNVMVTFRRMPTSEALRQHCEEKAQKFLKYLIEPVDIHVVLKVEKIRQIAEISVQSKNFSAHAVEESPDMYTSIDKVMSKMEQQLRRHKERVKNHKVMGKAFEAIDGTFPMTESAPAPRG
jgi:putative sigma-54 modulation protein